MTICGKIIAHDLKDFAKIIKVSINEHDINKDTHYTYYLPVTRVKNLKNTSGYESIQIETERRIYNIDSTDIIWINFCVDDNNISRINPYSYYDIKAGQYIIKREECNHRLYIYKVENIDGRGIYLSGAANCRVSKEKFTNLTGEYYLITEPKDKIDKTVKADPSLNICVPRENKYHIGYKCSDTNIEKVIFNDPATIIIWKNGDKTVVKCSKNDTYDKEKGLAMAMLKYMMGNDNLYSRILHKLIDRFSIEESEDNKKNSTITRKDIAMTQDKNGKIRYFKLDENGKKTRISKQYAEQIMKHEG